MKKISEKSDVGTNDPLLEEVYNYLTKFDFPLAYFIQKKFKIGFSRAEMILKQIENQKAQKNNLHK